MKAFFYIITASALLVGSVFISLYFEALLFHFVTNFNSGWVISTVLIRLIVMLLVMLAIFLIFKGFEQSKTNLKWIYSIIGIVPGFFMSFAISPIYDIDYGLLNDNLKLEYLADLPRDTNFSYTMNNEHEILAFVDVGCGHCKNALKKMTANFDAGQSLSVNLFFHNDTVDVNKFLTENTDRQFNHHYTLNEELFVKHAGFEFPSIYLIDPKGETLYHWVGDEMNYSALDYLLSLEP